MRVIISLVPFINICLLAIPLYAIAPDSTEAGKVSIRSSPFGLKLSHQFKGRAETAVPGPEELHRFFEAAMQKHLVPMPNGETLFFNSITVDGTTTTKVLTITGGADVTEMFPVVNEASPYPPPGTVMVIDQEPGYIKASRLAYDHRVVGVISGAGGICTGLTLKQEDRLDTGVPLSLTGRVYALASAENGSIRPGDLLTTSDTPGHAMKATDAERTQGSVLGKALSCLEDGEGLVLIVVTLQ